ncbi:alcohol dehydrogenase GroES-like domain-containing protein [Echria macrotheca]|uniref:Alcohol dehydrogenase GroES-like domain-containing protein n=1 Tax=Echria macrotheca TaxID=438768 RepID=A0AAJ0B5B2_9PEZI|nr:alcohol dehydrogenase GroES-like domain-containing protein [Echria macrotheca]
MSSQTTMKAVIFDGPHKVSVQDRPIPTIKDPKDVIIKVQATALCGSELHTYRGLHDSPTGFIMGHEFVGTVTETGPEVKTIQVGDKVVAPFTVSWFVAFPSTSLSQPPKNKYSMNCFYCLKGFTSRCAHSLLFGSPALDGGQAEFVRVPFADGTLMKAPPGIADRALVLTADIFPTGYFGAKNAFASLGDGELLPASEAIVVVVGCGPVGLCAIISALEYKPKHLFAVDSVDSRLELARGLGAEPLNFLHGKEAMLRRVKEVTEGRGADAVIEVVGLSPALRTAFDLLRPFGMISSIGVHNAEIPWDGDEAYGKNLRIQFGRCPVRSIAEEALEVLGRNQHKLSFMFDKIMPLAEAVEGYDLFDKMKVQKVIFTP